MEIIIQTISILDLEEIKILLLFPFFLFSFLISYFSNKYLSNNFSINILFFLILFLTSIEFYFVGNHNPYDLLTVLELPVILRDFNDNFLVGDLFTDHQYLSPKIVFAKIIHYFSKVIYLSIEDTLYLLKLIIIIINPLLLFKILTSFSSKNKFYLFHNSPINLAISATFSVGFFDFIQHYFALGWGSFSEWDFIDAMNLSNTLGLISILVFQLKGLKSIIGLILLFFVTLIHPMMGITNFTIILLFLNNNLNSFQNLKNLINFEKIKIFFFSVFLPLIFIIYIFKSDSTLTNNELVYLYAYEKHPFHFLVSSFFNFTTIIWLIFPLFTLIISLNENNKKLLIHSSFLVIYFPSCFLLQYYFTEINPYFFIVKSGPTRFLAHSLFFYIILLCIYFNKYNFNHALNYKINIIIFFNRIKNYLLFFVVFISVFFLFFMQKPILHRDPDAQEVISYFILNSKPEVIIFSDESSDWLLTYIRAGAKRRIFSDNSFIFYENAIEIWYTRRKLAKKIRNKISKNVFKALCQMEQLNIDYFIFYNSENLIDFHNLIVFKNNMYSIIDINSDNMNC